MTETMTAPRPSAAIAVYSERTANARRNARVR